MKKILITLSVFALGVMTLGAPAYALNLGVGNNTSVTATPNSASVSSDTSADLTVGQAKNRAQNERAQMLNVKQQIQANVAAFKQNLAAIKSAPLAQKKDFLVSTYNKAYDFFTNEHDQFVNALNVAASHGVDISVARGHFEDAWNILVQANADTKTLAGMNLSNATVADAKALAKKIEKAYIDIRNDMHLGAVALKVAIQARIQTGATTSVSSSSSQE